MAKIYDIKTKKELVEPVALNARDLIAKMTGVEGAMRDLGLEEGADHFHKALNKLAGYIMRQEFKGRIIKRAEQTIEPDDIKECSP